MENEDKKNTRKRSEQQFDGVVKVHETTTIRYYRERLAHLETRLIALEERLDEIEHILLLGRS